MATAPVYGYAGQLGIDTANPTTHRFDFLSSTLGIEEEFKDTAGLSGTRARRIETYRQGIRRADGQLKLQPTAAELAFLLPWIVGGPGAGSPAVSYVLTETVPSRFVQVDKVVKVATYDHCYVDKFTLKGNQGEPIDMTLDVVGIDETIGNSGSFPALSLDVANTPFMYYDLVLTIGGTVYLVRDFELVIDNVLDKERFYNSITRTAITATDRHITLKCMLPAGDAWAAYGVAAATGATCTAVFTDGGAILTFTFGKVTAPRKPVTVERPEIMIPFEFVALKTASTLELVTVLNPGP